MTLNPERLLALIGKMFGERDRRIEKEIDEKIAFARVDADLRIEQAHSQLKETRDLLQSAVDHVDGLKKLLDESLQEKARIVAAFEKAAAEFPEHTGPFVVDKLYRRNQMVTRDGSTYICAVAETSSDPREKDGASWRLIAERGERGAKGETGATGARGEKGEKGESGEKGDIGETGQRGMVGATGAQGAKGEKGEKGDPGRPGEKGPIGKTGERGPRGEPGIPGKKGDPGQDGREFVAVDIVGTKLVLTQNDGEAMRVDIKKAVEACK